MRRAAWILMLVASLALAVAAQKTPSKAGKSAKAATTKTEAKAEQIDVNSASKDELMTLPGIGDVTAQKIIDGRPYNSKRDLLTKKVVGAKEYDKIKDNIIAHRTTASGEKPAAKSKKK